MANSHSSEPSSSSISHSITYNNVSWHNFHFECYRNNSIRHLRVSHLFLALIKLTSRTWWILKEKRDLISLNLSSSSVTTPSYSFSRSGESKYWFQLFNCLNQSDRGNSGDDQGWRGHQDGEHCRKNLHLHTVPSLHNAGSWLGCIWSGSDLQLPLLCSASFSGLFSLTWFSFTNLLKVNVTNIKEKLVVRVFGYVFTAMKEEEKAEEAEEKLNVEGD